MNCRCRVAAVLTTLSVGLCACAPLRRLLWYPYKPYHASERFSFECPKEWVEKSVPGGVEFRESRGRAFYSIVFLTEGGAGYKPAEAYRKNMYDWGSVEDSHVVSQIILSSHTAYQVRFTAYQYDPQYMLGARTQVILTEVLLIPETDGIYAIRYAGEKRYFWKKTYRRYFEHFLNTLALAEPKSKKFRLNLP